MRLVTFSLALGLASICPSAAQFGGLGGGGRNFGNFSGLDQPTLEPREGPTDAAYIRPWVSATGVYRKVFSSDDAQQSISAFSTGRYGGSISGGVGGSKLWRRTMLTGGYSLNGSYYQSTEGTADNGPIWRSGQVGVLGISHMFTPRLMASFSQLAGTAHSGYGFGGFGFGGFGGRTPLGPSTNTSNLAQSIPGLGDPSVNGLVDDEVFDRRTTFYSSNAGVSYLLNRDWYVGGSANYSLIRREDILVDSNVVGGGAFLGRSIGPRMRVSMSYNISRLDYRQAFRNTLVQGGGVALFYQLTRNSAIQAGVGVNNLYSNYIGTVVLPPEIADLLGVPTTLEVQETRYLAPGGFLEYSINTRAGRFAIYGSRGISGGNGASLAGDRTIAAAAYSYAFNERVGTNASFTYGYTRTILATRNSFESYSSSGSVGVRLFWKMHGIATAGYRSVVLPEASTYQGRNNQFFASIGLAWSPGDHPLVF